MIPRHPTSTSLRRRAGLGQALLASLAFLLGGCQTVGGLVDPLNVRAMGKPPVRVGVTKMELAPGLFFLPKWSLLNDALAYRLQEPVAFQLMQPRQVRVHLGTGRLSFAMLPPGDYAEVAGEDNHEILAVPLNRHGTTSRRGLIVVGAKSPIQALSEIKNQRFHFLPEGSVLNDAALGALLEAGVAQAELDKGILGLTLDTRHISSAEVVKSVVLEGNVAGVIDEADYDKWPKTGGLLLLPVPLPSQDHVRIIARTVNVPEGPFLVSTQADPEMVAKVRDYLLNKVSQQKLVVAPLDYRGFAGPIDRKEYEPFFAIHRKLYPPQTQPADEGESDLPPLDDTDMTIE
jgi:ABC-type phosphate/phosphonate transport system substrate-binding protein